MFVQRPLWLIKCSSTRHKLRNPKLVESRIFFLTKIDINFAFFVN